MSGRVLVIQHVEVEGLGHLRGVLHGLDLTPEVVRVFDGQPIPEAVDADALIILGGPMGIADLPSRPHLTSELALVRHALDRDLPLLGFCLGSQLLAYALGSDVNPSGDFELGWHPVELTRAGRADDILGVLPPRFPALHWHGDIFPAPPGTEGLARSEATAVQAIRHGRAVGLLFHLEADPDQVAAMASAFPQDVASAGQSTRLLPDTEAASPAAAAHLDALVRAWLR